MVVAQRPNQVSLRGCIPPKVLEVWGTIFSLMTLRKSAAQGQLTDASNCSFLVWLRAWCSSHGHVGCQSPGAGKGPPWVTGWGHPWLSWIQEPGPPYRIVSHAPSGEAAGGGFDKLEPFGGWVVMLIRDWDTWASARKAWRGSFSSNLWGLMGTSESTCLSHSKAELNQTRNPWDFPVHCPFPFAW